MIDLRSDTVTRPSKGMLEAMLNAQVGDDVFGEDPTINLLENTMAARFGMEAGLFCPSGTMANQIAVMAQTNPGDEVILDSQCHIQYYEQGGLARNAGVSVQLINGDRGIFTANDVAACLRPTDLHFPTTKLVCAENTTNRGGGRIFPIQLLKEVSGLCQSEKLKFHLDGARLYNALASGASSEKDHGKIFDSISICLSKGLGSPVGSVLVGSKECITKSRRIRKRLGGGMRQAGILAAAGLYALENNIDRLSIDNRRAISISSILKNTRFVNQVIEPESNILIFKVDKKVSAKKIVASLEEKDVRCFEVGSDRIRFVFHLDILESDMNSLITAINQIDRAITQSI